MSTETAEPDVKLPEGWTPVVVTAPVRAIVSTYQRSKPQMILDDLVRQSAEEPDENLDTRAVDQVLPEHVKTVTGMIYNAVNMLSRARTKRGQRGLRVIVEERDSEYTLDDGTPLVQIAFRVTEKRPRGDGNATSEDADEGTDDDETTEE